MAARRTHERQHCCCNRCDSSHDAAALQGRAGVAPAVLTHPLEDLQPALARQAPHAGATASPFAGETVIWSSIDVPYLVTQNEVLLFPSPRMVS